MIKVLTIIGARPQIIKAAAISRAIREHFQTKIKEVIVHTGQHYDQNMSEIFMKELNIPAADYNLGVGSGNHGQQTAKMLEGLEQILMTEKPDALIIYGDTNSTLAGGLAAAKIHVPVVHIEAGLRSFNKLMPEEINRICCDHVSTLLFAPTLTAVNNLKKEGFDFADYKLRRYTIDHPGVFHCGDIMFDNSLHFAGIAKKNSNMLDENKLTENQFILATVHRDSNTDDAEKLSALFLAFEKITEQYKLPVVLPLHPRTAKMMSQLVNDDLKNRVETNPLIRIIPPASFLDMTLLESSCRLVLTDSGGVQKEAYFFKKPCVILRDETEWVELVKNGCARLAGADKDRIIEHTDYFMTTSDLQFPEVFGDGKAAEFICRTIADCFGTVAAS